MINRKMNISARYEPALAKWFNANYVPGDTLISRVASDLAAVKCERQLLFDSAAQAHVDIPKLHVGDVTVLGYNFEHRPQTPADEQADPLKAVKRMRQLANLYSLRFVFAPDREYGLKLAQLCAPFVDVWALQLQGFGNDVDAIHDYADDLITVLRLANNKIRLSFQFRQDVPAEEIRDIVYGFEPVYRPQIVSLLYEADNSGAVIQLAEVIR